MTFYANVVHSRSICQKVIVYREVEENSFSIVSFPMKFDLISIHYTEIQLVVTVIYFNFVAAIVGGPKENIVKDTEGSWNELLFIDGTFHESKKLQLRS